MPKAKSTITLFLCITIIFCLAISCKINRDILSGDLLFVGSAGSGGGNEDGMADAITASTGRSDPTKYFHVAIVDIDSAGNCFVIDATPKLGVAMRPLDSLVTGYRNDANFNKVFTVKRLKNNKDACHYVKNAREYVGQPYDFYFQQDNGMMYCSELVHAAYTGVFKAAPMNFKDDSGSFPQYWVSLFDSLNVPVPQDMPGTNPNDMARDKHLKTVKSF